MARQINGGRTGPDRTADQTVPRTPATDRTGPDRAARRRTGPDRGPDRTVNLTVAQEQESGPDRGPDRTGPEPYFKGIFSLYNTPGGGILIAYRPDDVDGVRQADQHIEIPAMVVTLAEQMSAGERPSPMQMLKMFKGL